jgi:hypothetical protein
VLAKRMSSHLGIRKGQLTIYLIINFFLNL